MSDLDFLKEMEERIIDGLDKSDPERIKYALQMVQDWIYELETDESSKLIYLDPKLEHYAEEYECAMQYLDKIGIPTEDVDMKKYSIVDRIKLLWQKRNEAKLI